MLRPGRLDKTLYVGLPTASDRLDILKTITKVWFSHNADHISYFSSPVQNGTKPLLGSDVVLEEIADKDSCSCYTYVELESGMEEAHYCSEALAVKYVALIYH